MNTLMRKTIGFLFFAVLVTSGSSVMAAELEGIAGKMISIDPYRSSIQVKTEVPGLFGPVEKDVTLDLAADVKWYICLGGSCAEKNGIEGAWMIRDYATYEPLGLRTEGCNVSMAKSGNAITEIWFEIC